ncbi:ccch zinc finger DNA-binding protein [Grosmannia clavigera kw1407]|uniref:Ccch zinc finger DNA-binding protein n=1 Tax=Grosmannia clavigera (strain kw1407 / UAMH 11150) TaxID=655863 RepID=F0X9N9_GROCL|nr:ccch zinc finger DNA-binding protein [Grosmannia clavigera kw1407]EFX05878.1 ccch zinc finger DNA-binding protein [Grosmannia clavigera kw1407]
MSWKSQIVLSVMVFANDLNEQAFKDQMLRLDKDYRDVCQELAKERAAKQSIQDKSKHQIKTLEATVAAHDKAVRDGSFVLVLVDADGDDYLMNNYLQQQNAVEGGSKAAKDLREAVRQHLLMMYGEQAAGLPVIAKAFASGHGRINVLERTTGMKRYDAQKTFLNFMAGFSQTEELFDFVVVDRGKERADRKLEASFRQFVNNPCCQHILLACCHDNGYVRMLEKFVGDPVASKKIVLVKSSQPGAEFASLPFSSTTLAGFFIQRPKRPPSPKFPKTIPIVVPSSGQGRTWKVASSVTNAPTASPTLTPSSEQFRTWLAASAVVTAPSAVAATLSVPNKSAPPSPLAGPPESPGQVEPKKKSPWWLSGLLGLSSGIPEKTETGSAAPSISVPDPTSIANPQSKTTSVPDSVPASVPAPVPAPVPVPVVSKPIVRLPVRAAASKPPQSRSSSPPANNLPWTPPATPPSQRVKPRTPSPGSRSQSSTGSAGSTGSKAKAKTVPEFGMFSENAVLVNTQNQRIDVPLPRNSDPVHESLPKKPTMHKKVCHQYQLQSTCFRPNCQYSHVKLSAGELLSLRRELRAKKCAKESACRSGMCIYGHSCTCSQTKKDCSFSPALHNVDTSAWKFVRADK